VLFVDSADKAARFIWLCDAFKIPLLYLADVPGFMIGTRSRSRASSAHGAKMIAAVSEATVPKISVVVRKAYGAGLYAMCGPAFEPDALHRAAEAVDRGHGPERRGQRRLLQQDPGDPEGPEREYKAAYRRREAARFEYVPPV
jgi:methylmalonyl-CoA decarboxylase subunit alpha